MSLSTCEHCGGHIPLGPDAPNRCEVCGRGIFGASYTLTPEDKEWLGFPADGRAELQPVIDRLQARVAELEAWQKEVANGLGYLNQPEGQAGYEVAAPSEIIHDWYEAQSFQERYREALEKIAAADYHEDGDVARAALNPITAE